LGGPDPLEGLSVYRNPGPPPHWHFVTYGFSELYEKAGQDSDLSGYGFELTFRLAAGEEAEPPAWALNLLQNLGCYAFETGAGSRRATG
jgi:suppressor of fused